MPWPNESHAGVTDQQVERGREQSEGRAADHEIEQRLAAEEHRQQIASTAKAASAISTSR